jgi:hypothetical protein
MVVVSPEEMDMAQEAKSRGLQFDPKKVKTINLAAPLSAQTKKRLEAISADGHVDEAVKEFKAPGRKDNKPLKAQDVEDTIRLAVEKHKEPLLLMSEQKKLRIMSYKPPEGKDLP